MARIKTQSPQGKTTSKTQAVQVIATVDKSLLSKGQKKFNELIKRIDSTKKLLQEWQETIPNYRQMASHDYKLAWDTYNDYRMAFVQLLDSHYDNKLFKKNEKAKISSLITDISFELIDEHGKEELKELYNRHNEEDYDSADANANMETGEIMKEMLEEMLGVKFDNDVDMSSPEKIKALLDEKLREKEVEHERRQQKRSQRKKTAKQLEKEARQKEEEQNTSKSIQAVFRQLVAALHPDREPDELERERKTKLMQQVNIAYGKKDLLQLLALQLELEQIDQDKLNNIAEERLVHFNKVLQNQLNELQQEIEQIEFGFKMQLNIAPFMRISPKQLMNHLKDDIAEVQALTTSIKTRIKACQEPTVLKAWLKTYRIH